MVYENANNMFKRTPYKDETEFFIRLHYGDLEGIGQEGLASDVFLITKERSPYYNTDVIEADLQIGDFDIMAHIVDENEDFRFVQIGRIFGHSINKNWLINDLDNCGKDISKSRSFIYFDSESQDLLNFWLLFYDMYHGEKPKYDLLDIKDETNSYIYLALSIELCDEFKNAAFENFILDFIIPNFYEKKCKNIVTVVRDFYVGESRHEADFYGSRGDYNVDSEFIINDLINHHNYKELSKDENNWGYIGKNLL